METKTSNFWWVKPATKQSDTEENANNPPLIIPRLDLEISSSLADFLEKEQNILNSNKDDLTDVDVGSIIDEINRVAAQSPLGPFDRNTGERSIDDIMKEAERIYMESSKSFEQLSQRSKTSQNITDFQTSHSEGNETPTPKSVSPLPLDPGNSEHSDEDNTDSYSEDFSVESKIESNPSPVIENKVLEIDVEEKAEPPINKQSSSSNDNNNTLYKGSVIQPVTQKDPVDVLKESKEYKEAISMKDEIIKTLEDDNKILRSDMRDIKAELAKMTVVLDHTRAALNAKSITSPEINLELDRVLENLKDSQEINTALQVQLDGLNKTHQHLKNSYEDLLNSNKSLERRVVELDATLDKYKNELLNIQRAKDKLLENETSLNKLLEIEKLQSKSFKIQSEKDGKCIQDLNRQIKEMERIIARKHPDSVSALIVAAKGDAVDSSLTARRVLEDRIKSLEQEALSRDSQSSKVFLDIQEKFTQMKLKYESHIDDLELHVSDLKSQLKHRSDTYDVYTQTYIEPQKIPEKDTFTVSTQTDSAPKPRILSRKQTDAKEDTHLLATIRGLQADLSNKEKVVNRQQKELDEFKKTNRRLQKEREGSLRNLSEKREFRSYPEKLAKAASDSNRSSDSAMLEEELRLVKSERNKIKQLLSRLEDDYQALKTKRLHDLTVLQEAHEREVADCVASLTPLREQLEVQQVTISTLQGQLTASKEELAIVSVERDHLNNVNNSTARICGETDVDALRRKIGFLEKRYEEREHRLRAIVHGLAQKNVTNKSCEQCADRQQQLIGYKVELDQLLATLRALT